MPAAAPRPSRFHSIQGTTSARQAWGTICVQADGGVRVHLREDDAKTRTAARAAGKREDSVQRKVWLSVKDSKKFKFIFFLHGKRVRKQFKLCAFIAWGSFCHAHMKANPSWKRPSKDGKGPNVAKCEPFKPAATVSDSAAETYQSTDTTAESASETVPSVESTVESDSVTISSATQSKIKHTSTTTRSMKKK